jgi:hypothetical protein
MPLKQLDFSKHNLVIDPALDERDIIIKGYF